MTLEKNYPTWDVFEASFVNGSVGGGCWVPYVLGWSKVILVCGEVTVCAQGGVLCERIGTLVVRSMYGNGRGCSVLRQLSRQLSTHSLDEE